MSIIPHTTPSYATLKEETLLLQELSQGSERAYTIIYTHYQPRLYRYVLPFALSHQMADEIVQDVLLKVWIKKESLIGIASFEKYLVRMTRNQLLDAYKKEKNRDKHENRVKRPEASPLEVENEYTFKEYQAIAVQAINQLPEKRRAVFQMWSQEGMSLEEIAVSLNISKAGVQKHLERSAHFIRDYLRKNGEWVALFIALITNHLD